MPSDATARDVIIADNDHIIRSILRSMLEGRNFSVLQAVDGLEALDFATRTNACLAILDYKMPRLDGFAACTQIRRLPGYADVPIIILSAFNDEAARTAAQGAGATMFMAKPFRPVDLLQAIANLVPSPHADGSLTATGDRRVEYVWKRQLDPTPLFGEQSEFSEGRRILNICRR